MPIETVLFDFDGTLADSLDLAVRTVNELARRNAFTPITREQTRTTETRRLLSDAGLKMYRVPRFLIEARALMGEGMDGVSLFPGIAELIADLKTRGLRLGIVSSNSAANVRVILDRAGLTSSFEHVVSGSSLFGKHSLISRLLKTMKADPTRTIFVGDETRDVEACRKIDLKCVAVDWGFHGPELLRTVGAEIVSNLDQLRTHLNQ